ncbi:MAG TPA: MFS transporter, partial [Chloroflexota bacterium]|nr:MFS transporter [Chloroflexota bacterium]
AMTGVFALLGGAVADHIGQKRALLIGQCGIPLAALIFLMHDFRILSPIVLVLGMTNSLTAVGGQSYLVASAGAKRLGGFSALYFLGSTMGSALGNFLVGKVEPLYGFATVGMIGFILALVLVNLTYRFLPDAPSRPPADRPGVGAVLASYRDLIRKQRILYLAGLRLLPTCFYGTTSLLLPLLIYRLSGSVATASLFVTTNLLIASASQLTTGRMIDRYGPVRPVLVLTTLLPFAAAATALSAASLPALFISGVIATSLLWGMSTTIPSLVRLSVPTETQGRTLGLLHLLWSSGMLIGTATGGYLVTQSPHLPFAVFAVLNLATAFLALAFRANIRRAARMT